MHSSCTDSIAVDPEDEKLALGKTRTGKSVSSQVLDDKPKASAANYSLWSLIKFIAKFNVKEWWIMCIGLVFTCLAGAGQPVQGIFFAKSIVALSQPLYKAHQIRHDINFWALMYLMLGLVQLISMFTSGIAFAYCSEVLIHRARDSAFRSMLRQDISFFDEDENSTGALTSFLSTENHSPCFDLRCYSWYTNQLFNDFSGCRDCVPCHWLEARSGLHVSETAMGLQMNTDNVSRCALPVILGSGFFRFWTLAKFTGTAQKAYKKSAGYACEHTNAIRTVASLTTETEIYTDYRNQLADQARTSLRSNLRLSALYAFSQSAMFLAIALGFWYGGTLIGSGEYSLFQFFICFSEIIFGAQSAGTVFSFAGDMSKAKNAAAETQAAHGPQANHRPLVRRR